MGGYRFAVRVDAPPEAVFALWTNLERRTEWIGGLTRISDISGPPGEAGTRFTAWFGSTPSPTEVLAAEPGRLYHTRFGNWLLRGEEKTTFEPTETGTLLTQQFAPEGAIPRVMARIFATGSWRGSFKGELNHFARLAERAVVEPDR